LGLTSLGIVVALINTQLRGPSLAHCIDAVAPAHTIAAAEFSPELQSLAPNLRNQPKFWFHGGDDPLPRIDRAITEFSGSPLSASERRAVTISDRALLIYTSGTTGLPKAANVSHRRVLLWGLWFAGLMNTGPHDRVYDCLPMYHSVGGIVATGAVLVRGGSVLIRDKFSAQHFWDDIVDGDCTIFQYIGELARYLVTAPPQPRERAHRLRVACGNGLRADIWEKFQKRFAIPRILEFYASTEGNFSLYNVEGRIGAIGRIPAFLRHRFPLALVKFDDGNGVPLRGEDGLCIRCATGEAGEAIGRIHDASARAGGEFEGYSKAEHSEQKILRDVFERGDAWYRTGDLMRCDDTGFYYFVDRIGDTFRWKGENVSTSEVGAAIATFPGVKEANVYGVRVPGTEGAAGMAAVVCDGNVDLVALRKHLTSWLPPYARPLFLRLAGRLEATATFKPTKTNLQREGFDPAATSDAIYFDDPAKKTYVRLDSALFARIAAGKVRV
jgi:fatty-acyl-CoA synthase